MSGLVLELQRDAMDKSVDVSDLLRKAMVVSRKLGINEIEDWINKELTGYGKESEIPDYREISGEVKVYNPYHGWQPLHFRDHNFAEVLSTRKIGQAVGQLDSIRKNNSNGYLQVPFNEHTKNRLMGLMDIALEPSLLVSDTQLHKILEGVRNEILNWSLDLEAKGIIGDGMSFSREEKKAASKITYNVTNNIGSMSNSQLQQDSPNSSQNLNVHIENSELSEFIQEIKSSLNDLKLDSEKKAELEAEISTIEHQLASPKPKKLIISESLKSTRSILESITSSVLATGLLSQLASIM